VPDSGITDVVAGWSADATAWIDRVGAVRIGVAVAVLLAGITVAVRSARPRRDPASSS